MGADALIAEHRDLARRVGLDWRLPGADRDDVEQIGLIALWEAARRYDPSRGVPFEAFARRVIAARLADALTAATRMKHAPVNTAVAFYALPDEDGDLDPIDWTRGKESPTEERVLELEALRDLVAAILTLTPLERRSIVRVVNGLGPADKRDDNALWRAKKRLRETLA